MSCAVKTRTSPLTICLVFILYRHFPKMFQKRLKFFMKDSAEIFSEYQGDFLYIILPAEDKAVCTRFKSGSVNLKDISGHNT